VIVTELQVKTEIKVFNGLLISATNNDPEVFEDQFVSCHQIVAVTCLL